MQKARMQLAVVAAALQMYISLSLSRGACRWMTAVRPSARQSVGTVGAAGALGTSKQASCFDSLVTLPIHGYMPRPVPVDVDTEGGRGGWPEGWEERAERAEGAAGSGGKKKYSERMCE